MKFSNKKTGQAGVLIIMVVFAVVYGLISLVNHYYFRTATLDLGMFNHALYDFAHLSQNYFTLSISGAEVNYFGDHFSPITVLYSPFYYLFGTYTLLIIQIAAILFGGYGVYKYAKLYHPNNYIPLIILCQFFGIWGIYSALAFDFHNNVVAAMFVPWLFYFYDLKKKKYFLLFFVLILITKENMALWLAFIMLGLMVKNGKFTFKKWLRFEIPLFLFSILYFVVIFGVVMPLIQDGLGVKQLDKYALLGGSLTEIISTFFTRPFYVFSQFFVTDLPQEVFQGIKSELHLMVLVSGGYAVIRFPYFLVMLLPIYAQKMLTESHVLWGLNSQYSIEFVPILSSALIILFSKFKNRKLMYSVAITATLVTFAFTYSKIEKRKSLWYNKVNSAFYDKSHYETELDLNEIYSQINKIPKEVPISVSAFLSPHMTFRHRIFQFPNVKEASYIVLFTAKDMSYPLSEKDFLKEIAKYKEGEEFSISYESKDLLIFKKNKDELND